MACGQALGDAVSDPEGADAGTVPATGARASSPPEPAAPAGAGLMGKTLLGFGPAEPMAAPPTASSAALSTGAEQSSMTPKPRERLDGKKTLLGTGQPGFAGQPAFAPLPPPAPAPVPPPTPLVPPKLSDKQTLLGVARPGIAPTSRGAQPVAFAAPPPLDDDLSGPPPLHDDLPGPPPARRAAGLGLAIAGIVGALVLGGLAFALWPRSAPRLEVSSLRVGATGDEIVVRCPDCADGTQASLSAIRAEFKNGEAIVKTEAPLTVGEHRLTLAITPPGGDTSTVEVVVPVAFRARAVLSRLGDDVPSASVEVSARVGSRVTVAGQPLTLDEKGITQHSVDLTRETSGEAAASETLSQKIDVSVTPPGGAERHSTVELRASVTPLVLNAPGRQVVLRGGDLIVSGRTAPNASVRLGRARTTADAEGRFVLTVRAPEPGSLRLAATGEGLATRGVTVALKRTADAAPAPIGFDQLRSSLGKRVALEGQVVDARAQADGSSLLLEITRGCAAAPCLVGVLYPARLVAGMPARGQELVVVGDVARAADGSPRVRAETFAVR